MREHRAGCRFRPPPAPSSSRPPCCWPVARHVRLRNPSKSTLAHDAVAAVVLHKHHLIICVGAGLIQFLYGSHWHSCMAADLTLDKNLFSQPFSRGFLVCEDMSGPPTVLTTCPLSRASHQSAQSHGEGWCKVGILKSLSKGLTQVYCQGYQCCRLPTIYPGKTTWVERWFAIFIHIDLTCGFTCLELRMPGV